MRYTEAKLSPVAAEMLEDIKLDTVDFQPNYDEKYQEPRVLPGKFPNLLVNGSGGNRRRHGDIDPAAQPRRGLRRPDRLYRRPGDRPRRRSWRSFPGPIFPPARTICGRMGIREAYRTGRGGSSSAPSTRSKSSRTAAAQIVFTEIPYQLTKEPLLKKLAELVNGGRITGVSNIDDFSDRKQPVRIAVTVKKGEDPNVVVNQLFEYSPLQDTFSVIMLALVDGRPKTLPLEGIAAAVRRAPDQRDPPAHPVPASPGHGSGRTSSKGS